MDSKGPCNHSPACPPEVNQISSKYVERERGNNVLSILWTGPRGPCHLKRNLSLPHFDNDDGDGDSVEHRFRTMENIWEMSFC